MDRREIETFLTLCEELHFGRTAQRLYVSQSRVSQTIAALERRLGVPLFERTSRRVALTPVGAQLARDVRAGHDRILAGIATAVASGAAGDVVLRVGLEAPAVADLAAEVFARFARTRPSTSVALAEADFVDPLATLRRGDVDVLVTDSPVDEPDLTAGPVVAREPVVLAVASGHRLGGRAEVCLADLAGETVLRAGRRGPPYWTGPSGADRVPTTFQELLGAVARGAGVCPVAAHAADYFARPTLRYVPFDTSSPWVQWCLTWRTGGASADVLALARLTRGRRDPA